MSHAWQPRGHVPRGRALARERMQVPGGQPSAAAPPPARWRPARLPLRAPHPAGPCAAAVGAALPAPSRGNRRSRGPLPSSPRPARAPRCQWPPPAALGRSLQGPSPGARARSTSTSTRGALPRGSRACQAAHKDARARAAAGMRNPRSRVVLRARERGRACAKWPRARSQPGAAILSCLLQASPVFSGAPLKSGQDVMTWEAD